jgi:hypothetical protein
MKRLVPFALIVVAGCGGALRNMVRDAVAQKGQVLREWKSAENEDRMIVREGNRINEYRVYSLQVGLTSAAQSELVYSVDTVTELCYGGPAQSNVPCPNLRRDPDMGPFVPQPARSAAD